VVAACAMGPATPAYVAARRAAAALAKQVEDRLAEALRRELEKP
jgi:hypothetical protein